MCQVLFIFLYAYIISAPSARAGAHVEPPRHQLLRQHFAYLDLMYTAPIHLVCSVADKGFQPLPYVSGALHLPVYIMLYLHLPPERGPMSSRLVTSYIAYLILSILHPVTSVCG
jgi:hypothetical protein